MIFLNKTFINLHPIIDLFFLEIGPRALENKEKKVLYVAGFEHRIFPVKFLCSGLLSNLSDKRTELNSINHFHKDITTVHLRYMY